MKECVVIKSYQNGVCLKLKQEADFSDILMEVAYKFHESDRFFGTARMALSFEGRELTPEEEDEIVRVIHENCGLQIVCIVGRDESVNERYMEAILSADKEEESEADGYFYKGNLKNQQVLETESSIVILGDVHVGCSVISSKDIIILGGLYGEAYAGGDGKDEHYIVALEMQPEKLKIGDFKYKSKEKKNRWSGKVKMQPQMAYVKGGKLVIEPLTKELLGTF